MYFKNMHCFIIFTPRVQIRFIPDPNEDPEQATMQKWLQDDAIAETYIDLPYIRYVIYEHDICW